ncbi:hypothetical protein BLOT_004514 [Blomia tropicalis]|nr:hypothetical protein BLOT_004514 [Blomia tropicalis]
MKLNQSLRYKLLCIYMILYYYQELVKKFKIHYNRRKFSRIGFLMENYQLYQYRKLYGIDSKLVKYNSWFVPIPTHIKWIKYYVNIWIVRMLLIKMPIPGIDNNEKLIWLGTVFFGKSGNIETTIFFWLCMCYFYLKHCISNSLLSYKFLFLNQMNTNQEKYLHPSNYGLNKNGFNRFHKFRFLATLITHITVASVTILGGTVVAVLEQLFVSFLKMPKILCTNLVYFIIVAEYIRTKQRCIIKEIRELMHKMHGNNFKQNQTIKLEFNNWSRFIKSNVSYTHLYEEIADYNPNISFHLEHYSKSGFYLLNGYVLHHNTIQLLVTSITTYFLLMLKNRN